MAMDEKSVERTRYMNCKHFTKNGSECKCALNRPEFWNNDMCYVDKAGICSCLELDVQPVQPE
jgi:hypothetical protein